MTAGYAEWAATRSQPRFSDWLREGAGDVWAALMEHRFFEDMGGDSLPPGAFEDYLRLEHAFVGEATRVFGHALVAAPTVADQRHLARILVTLTDDQQSYFEAARERLGMGSPAPGERPRAAAALADCALAVAAHGTFEEILSMMLAAEWLYLSWCRAAHRRGPSAPEPARWIALHVGGEFEAGVDWARRRVDRLGPELDPARQLACRRAFRRLLEEEGPFHDAVYAGAA